MTSDAQNSAPSGVPEPEASKGRPLEGAGDGAPGEAEGPPSKRVKLDDYSPATPASKSNDGTERRKGLAPIKAEYFNLPLLPLNHTKQC